uniref:START domain-containing protein n=1 Tax=Haptolina ericina TaxID=156174 RepID=A0A7S3FJR5_9EUKA
MKLSVMGVKLEYFINHMYHPKLSVLTWTLDYGRLSDLIDSVGYWCVVPHPTVAGHSRVYYSVDAALPSWVPGFVVTAVTSKALTDATHWVKVESEKVSTPTPRTKRSCRKLGGVWTKSSCVLPAPPLDPSVASSTEAPEAFAPAVATAVTVGILFYVLRDRSSRIPWE